MKGLALKKKEIPQKSERGTKITPEIK